ncbi:MAG: hypothetical protein SFV54_25605 [Bryobacteraceae bacterium]|nr:hypothetical protein [Bryobacteraceae bacterium]
MRSPFPFVIAALCCAAASPLLSLEVATGFLLGPRYDQRAFYVRSGPGEEWKKTYSGPEFRRQAQGKMMNLRLAQGLFHDEWLTEKPFDPAKNTEALVGALDFYRQHGVLMINVSMQGGNPGYEEKVNGIRRQRAFHLGPGEGAAVSGFRADGSLKEEWMRRLETLLRAANDRGMVVNLMYFYQGQDEQFESPEAIQKAAANLTDWLIDKNFRNVVIDIANEWDHSGWDFDNFIPTNLVRLADQIRERFQQKRTDWALPVGASSDGRMLYPDSLMKNLDLVMVHGNRLKPEDKGRRLADFRNFDRPVVMTEDDNGRETTPANLALELASCSMLFERAQGWGYMPWVQSQRFPFRWLPGPESQLRDDMPVADRDMAYFHAVLDHIAELVLIKPPCGRKR